MQERILWRRLDRPGHEACRLGREGDGWSFDGSALFPHEGRPCRLDYVVRCDAAWRTLSACVRGWVGGETIDVEVTAEPSGRWRLNGRDCPDVAGAIDVDLNFSPSTNLLPIRRLSLPVGGEAVVRAAWLRFPSFRLEPLEQVYRRTAERAYRYESDGGRFVVDLEVTPSGLVARYPGGWEVEAAG